MKSKKLSKSKNIKHGFLNKFGGESRGIYTSLNCGLGSFDKKKDVLNNLKIAIKKITPKKRKIILLHQIHSDKFIYISKKSKFKRNNLKGDAIITDKKNTPIGVLTADCAPILIHDNNKNMISAVHVGWKGAFKDILKNVINFMLKKGCTLDSMTAVIGPCISSKNYEVKKDFKNKFLKKNKNNKIFFRKIKNKIYFDLSKYINSQLKSLKMKNIEIIDKDTFNEKNNFFSARRSISRNENDYGRNVSIIMLN